MKPLNRKNYGSIPHLSSSKLGSGDHYINFGQERMLTTKKLKEQDIIFSSEKYDGSNVGIAKLNGKLLFLNREGYEVKTSPYVQQQLFEKWAQKRYHIFDSLLQEGERVVGEWLLQAHGLKYEIKGEPIVFFDLFNAKNQRIPYNEFLDRLGQYNLPTPRILHTGEPAKVEDLIPVLKEMEKCFFWQNGLDMILLQQNI